MFWISRRRMSSQDSPSVRRTWLGVRRLAASGVWSGRRLRVTAFLSEESRAAEDEDATVLARSSSSASLTCGAGSTSADFWTAGIAVFFWSFSMALGMSFCSKILRRFASRLRSMSSAWSRRFPSKLCSRRPISFGALGCFASSATSPATSCSPAGASLWNGTSFTKSISFLPTRNPRTLSPAALSSLLFCSCASLFASSSCFSLAFRFAFFPLVFASRARASLSISFSSSSMSTGSGRAGFDSGAGSISPGRRRRAASSGAAAPAVEGAAAAGEDWSGWEAAESRRRS
mmetsp:Transcript_23694/g.58898  ORF Transcript_23694/g.58898 Transcript_23694/m.58898 type:complete len:289 (+) Transcript_23694:1277-2143(+)